MATEHAPCSTSARFVDMRKRLKKKKKHTHTKKKPNRFDDAEAAKLLMEVTFGERIVMSSFQNSITNKKKDETWE